MSSVTLDRSTLELSVDSTARLTATVRPENADERTVVWQSSSEETATVEGGIVRGMAEGRAEITATARRRNGCLHRDGEPGTRLVQHREPTEPRDHRPDRRRVAKGRAYKATLHTESGYTLAEVVIKMDGEDITGTAWDAGTGVVRIEKVTGNVVITARARR